MMPEPTLPRPLPYANWYPVAEWLVAGEYPGAKHGFSARVRLDAFLDAGITAFIDLTEAGEWQRDGRVQPYDAILSSLADDRGVSVSYQRFPIPDVGVPGCHEDMRVILDAMDAARLSGHGVYVHCYGGVGRTGTVVGCHLVRSLGLDGGQALAELQRLWRRNQRSARSPRSPETAEQENFVRYWREPVS